MSEEPSSCQQWLPAKRMSRAQFCLFCGSVTATCDVKREDVPVTRTTDCSTSSLAKTESCRLYLKLEDGNNTGNPD